MNQNRFRKEAIRLATTLFLLAGTATGICAEGLTTQQGNAILTELRQIKLPELVKKYVDTGKVKFIPMDFPLDFHKNAMKAAQATRCAGDQEKYWSMRDLLLREPKLVEEGNFSARAKELGLNEQQFQSCMDDQKHAAAIKAMMDAAKSAGISGTPSFVIAPSGETLEGVKIVGAMPLSIFEEKIKEALGAGKR
jgi:protein-disulfide isomerase